MKHLYLLITVCISFCAGAQSKFVSIGSGGGFAGTVTAFKITPDGKVFKGKGVGDITFTECSKLKKSKAKRIVAKAGDQAPSSSSFHHPGNLYYYITYTGNGKEQTVTWGDADHPVPEHIKKLYDEIQTSVSALKYKPVK